MDGAARHLAGTAHRRRARRFGAVLLGLAVVAAVSACGSGESSASAAPSTSSSSAPSPSDAAGTPDDGTTEGPTAVAPTAALTAETTAVESPASGTAAPSADESGGEGDCPLAATDIGSATSMEWEFQISEAERPHEFDENILTAVCIFTATEMKDEYGDAGVLRTDSYTGESATAAKAAYETSCTASSGTLKTGASNGVQMCDRDGLVSDGQVTLDDGVVEIGLLTGDATIAAAKISPAFEKILNAVG